MAQSEAQAADARRIPGVVANYIEMAGHFDAVSGASLPLAVALPKWTPDLQGSTRLKADCHDRDVPRRQWVPTDIKAIVTVTIPSSRSQIGTWKGS
jgi:hypothetical protein